MTENARYYFDAERFPQGIDWPREPAQLSPGPLHYAGGRVYINSAPIPIADTFHSAMKALAQNVPDTSTWSIAMQRLANIAR